MTHLPLTFETAIPCQTSVVSVEHPEWGTFGVAEHRLDIDAVVLMAGSRRPVVFAGEFRFWRVVGCAP